MTLCPAQPTSANPLSLEIIEIDVNNEIIEAALLLNHSATRQADGKPRMRFSRNNVASMLITSLRLACRGLDAILLKLQSDIILLENYTTIIYEHIEARLTGRTPWKTNLSNTSYLPQKADAWQQSTELRNAVEAEHQIWHSDETVSSNPIIPSRNGAKMAASRFKRQRQRRKRT